MESLLDGPYAYWVGSAIQSSALAEENEDTLQSVISLFVVENLASMTNEETAAQRAKLVGTWDCDFSAFPEYGNAQMYIVLSADGEGKTYADFMGTGDLALTAEYTFFAFDSDAADEKNAGTYIAMNTAAEPVTPGAYEIVEEEGKTALVFTSNEGVITYILRNEYIHDLNTKSCSTASITKAELPATEKWKEALLYSRANAKLYIEETIVLFTFQFAASRRSPTKLL